MFETLLATKLFIPSTRRKLVSRPRLIKRLNGGLHRKLTHVSAPAGFGKTTLVVDWLENLEAENDRETHSNVKFAWLSLDGGDNDPARFLAYFIAALNQAQGVEASIGIGSLNMLQSPQPPPTEAVLTPLINEIAAISGRIILVLDDYHVIESTQVDDILTFLLEYLPPQMHLVIASREDPHLPLSRFRARGQLTELRAADLRFSASEAAEFLNQVMSLDLSANNISTLETRTEGWIAGLQLAAISMQGREDHTEFIRAFTGSNRLVLDYLIEEVLDQLSESIQSFLLQTSILDQLTGPLCDVLTEQEDSQATLELLDRSNLFIIPLDEERCWYRYHHLFADLLLQHLKQIHPGQMQDLHQKASTWYEQNGYVDEAIEHALRADDFKKAAQLIEEQVDAVSEHTKILRWLDELPVEVISSKPQLCIFRARHLFSNGQLEKAEQALQVAEHALNTKYIGHTGSMSIEQDQQSNAARNVIIGMTAVIRAFLAIYKGQIQETIDQSRKALDYLPEQDMTWRSAATLPFGDAIMFKGDIEAAYDTRMETLEMCKKSGHPYLILVSNGRLAWTLRQQGKLKQVIELCEQQVQNANQCGISDISVCGWIMTLWGEALAELNDLAGAIQKANNGVELIGSERDDLAVFGWGNLNLVKILFSKGDMVGVKEVIQRLENIFRDTHRLILNQVFAWKARIWLEENELEAASKWVEDFYLNANENLNLLSEIECIVITRTLINQGRLDEATKHLLQLLNTAEAGKHISRIIKILILQAMVFQAGDDTTQALVTLERALTLAEPEGFIRIFVDEGPVVARLLHEALVRGISPDYIRQLLAAFPLDEPEQVVSTRSKVDQSQLIEPLSDREIEVLQLIAEGLTNPEISSRLFVSLNTVKTHTRNIYAKLGAHTRTQAVARGRALGIVRSVKLSETLKQD